MMEVLEEIGEWIIKNYKWILVYFGICFVAYFYFAFKIPTEGPL